MFRLVFLSGPNKGRRLAVQQGDVVIGSDPDCPVRISGARVSPRHAVLEGRGRSHFIRTLDDSAILIVNGKSVSNTELSHGDQMDIGSTRILFQKSESGARSGRRRTGKMLGFTAGMIAAIIIIQVIILTGLLVYWWYYDIDKTGVDSGDEPVSIEEETEEHHRFAPVEPWML